MYKIGVISDTHGLLREEVLSYLKDCQLILHGGDINKPEIIERLEAIAPLKVVRGNNDKGEWAEALPLTLQFTVEGKKFFMVHNKKDIDHSIDDLDFIIYGHSHKYYCEKENDTHILNPGSCGKRRFDLEITMATITICNDEIDIEKINISH